VSAAGPYRLPSARADRAIEFHFNNRRMCGIEGDTVASALLGNGVRVVARSFKFHRPRGIFSAGFEEPNALLQLHSGNEAIPSVRAPLTPLRPALEVFTQSGWPAVRPDLLRILDFAHPLFAAGFYNKTFKWPTWRTYEPLIRRLTGLGRVPPGSDPDRYETRHTHCDVLVIGGGPAGIEAALSHASSGAEVLLVEQRGTFQGDATSLTGLSNVRLLPRTAAVAYYDHDLVTLAETTHEARQANSPRERLWLVRARRVVLATGTIEQPLIFSNNDRPGVMLAGAALRYLRDHAIAPGRQVLLATNNDSAYGVARALQSAGVAVRGVIDSRAQVPASALEALGSLQIRSFPASIPVDTAGFGALKSVTVGRLSADQRRVESRQTFTCDALLVSGGWSPVLHLFAQAGGKLTFDEPSGAFRPASDHPSIEIAGEAGRPPSGSLGLRISPVGNPARQWLDLLHDVTVADIQLAIRENFTAVEHVKRHTTLGMAADQGKIGQAPAAEVIARTRGIRPAQLGHTTFRPPFVPVTLGTLVGRNVGEFFAPTRRTPLHAVQAEAGALFADYGEWRRSAAFPRDGKCSEQSISREVQLVRNRVGLYDASSLGKIELAGPDALEFADRFYVNDLLSLTPGRTRYGIMLRETGVIFDDGTIVMLDTDRVLLTTTSGGAGRVAAWLEEWRQCEWPQLRVVVVPVTEQWATVALSGRHARAVLERLKPGCDLSNDAFPHLSLRQTRLLGHPTRIQRVSFSGELTYEINVPSHAGPQLWAALQEAGRCFGIAPYGVEALLHLRMEKGFLHIGTDTDGTTIPDDVGFGRPAAAKGRHYIGKRSLSLPEHVRPDRLQLVGLRSEDSRALPVGAHLLLTGSQDPTDGWITSAGLLSGTGTPIAMAMLRAGRAHLNQVICVHDAGRVVATARIVAPVFYDIAGERCHG